MKQETALKILQTGVNVFLTGEPGSGKTHTVNAYVKWLRERGIEPAITASTGIAATHIHGMTIHSWSGIGIKQDLSAYDLDKIAQNERVVRRVRDAKILIIDEVSMLSSKTLAMAEAVCREIRQRQAPFGGLQVVLVGDFFQLPPVVRREENQETEPQISFETGEVEEPSHFAFSSRVWKELNPLVCYLSEQHRQEDAAFLDLLSGIRRGAFSPAHRTLLESRRTLSGRDGTTQLYSHNADVDRINDVEIGKISGDMCTFAMTSQGKDTLVTSLKRGCLSPEILALKVGARVMFTKNDIEHKYVNGTLGTVTGFVKESGYPIIKTNPGRSIIAEPEEWHIEDGGRVLAKITQIPLRLAWAITVHKSQGMSLDAAHMDLSQAFEYGQGYVALSRVRTLAGLSLSGLNERALEVHPEVAARDRDFKLQSAAARKAFEAMEEKEHAELMNNFIVACGGRLNPHKSDFRTQVRLVGEAKRAATLSASSKKYSVEDMRKKHPNAYRSWSKEEDT
ncbi:MAG: PIF1 family ATP-dependent DNA helicase [bacterium]|nr:PIF1 family ATP-dependent DNA helicase [bacterium]